MEVLQQHNSQLTLEVLFRVDGSWIKHSQRGIAAWIAYFLGTQNSTSHAQRFLASSALHTKAKACLLALTWARHNDIARIILMYTDSANLVRLLQSPTGRDITIQHTIDDIRVIVRNFQWCRIVKVSREEVAPAHDLTTLCCVSSFSSLSL